MAAEGSVSSSERREWLAARIARSGYCSRRAATPLIRSGRVRVNGQAVTDPSTQVGHGDEVRVGRRVLAAARKVTLLLNKPVGFVTTLSDPQGRPTVANLLPDVGVALKPVGRLDLNTEGLLICTSDGELANRLMHPRYEVEKEYLLTVSGAPDERALRRLREGVVIEGVRTHPARVDVLRVGKEGAQLRFVLHEGRNRQVRNMAEAVGLSVRSLKRIRVGPFTTRGLQAGACRLLGKREVGVLRKLVGLGEESS